MLPSKFFRNPTHQGRKGRWSCQRATEHGDEQARREPESARPEVFVVEKGPTEYSSADTRTDFAAFVFGRVRVRSDAMANVLVEVDAVGDWQTS
jgi:hypothetical protein